MTEQKYKFGALILQLEDLTLEDGDLTIISPNSNPGFITVFIDFEDIKKHPINVSRYGVTTSIEASVLDQIKDQLTNDLFEIHVFDYIPAKPNTAGVKSLDYDLPNAKKIVANLSGQALTLFTESDKRFDKKNKK